MEFLARIMRIIRANINSLIGKAEDPEKILEQAVADMQEELVQMRQAVAQAIATQKRTERQASQAESNASEWQRRAQLALNKGDENLAREALVRKKSYQETATGLRNQLDQQNQVVDDLKKKLRTLENKISEAKTKKDMYIARARTAKASEQLNQMLNRNQTGSALEAFERMEEQVMELEARSEAIEDMGGDQLEKQFSSLESSDVDDELAAMKAQISGRSQQQLSGTSQEGNNGDIEAQLKQMRTSSEEKEKES
jgi:phage shock protein A